VFGEYGIYCDGKIVALVCDDQLFVKPTLAGENYLGKYTEGLPYPGAKPWFLIVSEQWNDSPWLSQLISSPQQSCFRPKKSHPREKASLMRG
jgi:DNA transformation protein and related proteins